MVWRYASGAFHHEHGIEMKSSTMAWRWHRRLPIFRAAATPKGIKWQHQAAPGLWRPRWRVRLSWREARRCTIRRRAAAISNKIRHIGIKWAGRCIDLIELKYAPWAGRCPAEGALSLRRRGAKSRVAKGQHNISGPANGHKWRAWEIERPPVSSKWHAASSLN